MKRTKNFKALMAILAVALLLVMAVGGTIAWIAASTDPVVNEFTPGQLPPSIEEKFESNAKKEITVTNTGNIDAYVRVAIVANWYDADGNVVGPYTGSITINTTDWFKQGDYYYYKKPVAGGTTTSNLLAANVGADTKPYPTADHLDMVVITQSIQTQPTSVVETQWKVVTVDGNGNLTAKTN